jgi:hypothetical protein
MKRCTSCSAERPRHVSKAAQALHRLIIVTSGLATD